MPGAPVRGRLIEPARAWRAGLLVVGAARSASVAYAVPGSLTTCGSLRGETGRRDFAWDRYVADWQQAYRDLTA